MEWVEIVEPRTKEHMYANLTTGECVWEPPPGVPVKRADDNQWWELFDHNTSRFYYYNACCQKTVWHRPHNCDIIPLAKLQTLKQNTQVREDRALNRDADEDDGFSEAPRVNKVMVCSETQTTPPSPRKHSGVGGGAHHRHHHHQSRHRQRHGSSGKEAQLVPPLSSSSPPPQLGSAQLASRIGKSASRRDTGTGTTNSSVLLESPQSTSSHSSSPTHHRVLGGGAGTDTPPLVPTMLGGGVGVGEWFLQRRDSGSRPRGSGGGVVVDPSVSASTSAASLPVLVGRSYSFLSSSGGSRHGGGDSSLEKKSLGSESTPQPQRRNKLVHSGSSSGGSRGIVVDGSSGGNNVEGFCTPMLYRRQKSCDAYSSPATSSGLNRHARLPPAPPPPTSIRSNMPPADPSSSTNNNNTSNKLGSLSSGSTSSSFKCKTGNSAMSSASIPPGLVLTTSGNKQMAVISPNNIRPSRSLHSGLVNKAGGTEPDEQPRRTKSKQTSRPSNRVRDVYEEEEDDIGSASADLRNLVPLERYLLEQRKLTGYRFLPEDDDDEDEEDDDEEGRIQGEQQRRRRGCGRQQRERVAGARRGHQDDVEDEEDETRLVEFDDSDEFADDEEGMSAASSQEFLDDDAYPEEERETYARFRGGVGGSVRDGRGGGGGAGGDEDEEHRSYVFRPISSNTGAGVGGGGGGGEGGSSNYDSPDEDAGPVLALRASYERDGGNESSRSSRTRSQVPPQMLLRPSSASTGLQNRHPPPSEPHIYSPVVEIPFFNNKLPQPPSVISARNGKICDLTDGRGDMTSGAGIGDGAHGDVADRYVQENLNVQKRGLFRKSVPVRELLSWSKEAMAQPLLVTADKTLRKEKRELFKLVQIYMSDRRAKIGMTISSVAHKIVSAGCRDPRLRDELYLDLCKQTRENPRRESLRRGWELLCICLAFFPPSARDLAPFLRWYIQKHRHPDWNNVSDVLRWPIHVQVSHYAGVCEQRLDRILEKGSSSVMAEPTSRDVDRARVQIFRPTMFGCTLEEVMALQRERFPDRQLPWVLCTLAEEVLRLGGGTTLGIFREAPDHRELDGTQDLLDRFQVPDWTNPLVPAALLKRWLADLHQALIPPEVLSDVLSTTMHQQEKQRSCSVDQMNAVLSRMPPLNRLVLGFLVNFLQRLVEPDKVEVHRMTAYNLAVVFTPNVTRLSATDPLRMQDEALRTNAFFHFLLDNMDASFAHNLI